MLDRLAHLPSTISGLLGGAYVTAAVQALGCNVNLLSWKSVLAAVIPAVIGVLYKPAAP